MKYVFRFFLLAALVSFSCPPEEIYSLEVKTINGEKISLNDFKGKKMLIVTIPLEADDHLLPLQAMDSLQEHYGNSLIVLAIPAEEWGYSNRDGEKIKKLYKNLKPTFILLEGMKIKKAAGAAQSPLFRWLTSKDRNRHFDQDAEGPGQKFFVDENGVLYAVMGAQTKLTDPIIGRILSKPLSRQPL